MKKVLVTNDDGIDVTSILKLVETLSKQFEVYAVAPMEQQSAKSMAVTFLREVRAERKEIPGAAEAYAIDGTPVDCVRWAIDRYAEQGIKFDYLISGINLGTNVGIAAYYSGTVGAAREGALAGVRSIALSVGTHWSTHFDYTCSLIPKLIGMSDSLSPQTILNFNAPDLPPWEVKGLRIVEAAPYGYAEKYSFIETGNDLYQLKQVSLDGKPALGMFPEKGSGMISRSGDVFPEAELRYDLDCVRNGYAAITPLSSSVNDDIALRRLQGRYSSDDVIAVFMDTQENLLSGIRMRNSLTGSLSRFAACMSRLDVPVAVTELLGYGPVIPEIAKAFKSGRSEDILRRELSAWGSADFVCAIESSSARRVLIAGVETHTAILQTALDFMRRGYEVTIIEDCCASRDGHDHKMAIERLRDADCTVTTSRAAVMELISAVNHPAADAVMKILG